ncbi:CDP-glycerol glycerophosphotransferase family protein [Nonomuraea sp. NPDC003804]|uniref:bifunctional glycosyltransferase/CDP-glycerol:glycerophosphate glycerophosphotransferase n=1 Tax=Nonomuraea sp. NPDC003804 TaxID=3154547 RepID=UPI0033A4E26C
MPDCTVVVITYNDAARLPRAVRSVLDQTLRDLEVIICDDASTDDTPRVAGALTRADPRVRYVRRQVNSGGCGAPRNDGLDAALSPYVMFLDSDDTLPRHACKSLLTEIERTGADFVSGQIARLYESSGRTHRYYPHLFARRRTVEGIREEPDLFLDCFTTNKLFDVSFLRRHALRFPEDILYEDHVFGAEMYCAARRFAVVPWTVYHWHRPQDGTSISMSTKEMDNVRHRLEAARRSDAVLRAHGFGDLVPDRQYRFVRQDLRVYLNPLPSRDVAWAAEFAGVVRPYLAQIPGEVLERLPATARVCCHLILADRAEDLRVAARSLNGPQAPPREVVTRGGRTYWGRTPAPGMDITALHLAELPYTASRLRHEVVALASAGTRMRLRVRTYDPFGVLTAAPGWTASLRCGTVRTPLSPVPDPDGGYLSEVTVDLATLRGRGDPRIGFTGPDGRTTTDVLLADPCMAPFTLRHLRVSAEGSAGQLCVRPRRTPRVALSRLKRVVLRRLGMPRTKLAAYKALIRLVPPRPDLALFEADCGKGYTGSPRAVYEEVRRRGLPVSVVWSVARARADFPSDAALVRRGSWRYVWTMARAGVWVDSHGFPLDHPKPRGTRYLQTWHGQGIKSIGFDAPDLRADLPGPREQWRAAVARWDALISPSAEFSRYFVPALGYEGRVLRYGTPRCDALVRGRPPEGVRERLEIPPGRKILLYAPTYRDGAKGSGASVRVDLEELAEALSGEWALILRTHPVERYQVPPHLRHFVTPAGSYPEINDLILVSDALLTDYSSVMCDYAVTGKPMLFFVDDWDEYRLTERGVNTDLPAIAPGPCVTTTADLVECLRHLPAVHASFAARYAAARRLWCEEERGDAAARVVADFFRAPLAVPVAERSPLRGAT